MYTETTGAEILINIVTWFYERKKIVGVNIYEKSVIKLKH